MEKSNSTLETSILIEASASCTVLNRPRKVKGLINEEFCSYCKEGGNLLNCDRCPSSFHFLCHEPPLDPDQIPKGDFLCSKCVYEFKTLAAVSAHELKHLRERKPLSSSSSSGAQPLHHNDLLHVFKHDSDSTLDMLIRMSKAFNPCQMRLSNFYKLKYDSNVPGTNKFRLYQKSLSQINSYKTQRLCSSSTGPGELTSSSSYGNFESLTNGTAANGGGEVFKKTHDSLKSQLKICQTCKRLVKPDKIVYCDFCASCYHIDCIFTIIDSTPNKEKIWMCPNHIEHMLNIKLLKSDRLTEKINTWKSWELNKSDVEMLKSNFIRKCRQNSLKQQQQQRYEKCTNPIQPDFIPDEIKFVYNEPDRSANESTAQPDNGITESDMIAIEAFEMLLNSTHNSSNDTMTLNESDSRINEACQASNEDNDMTVHIAPNLQSLSNHTRAILKQIASCDDVDEPDTSLAIYLNSASVSIGTDHKMDVRVVNNSPECELMSKKHLTIYYDHLSDQHELLNYSEFGTLVDDHVYGLNDLSPDQLQQEPDAVFYRPIEGLSTTDNFNNHQFTTRRREKYCPCRTKFFAGSSSGRPFIEGPAVLQHGSTIQLGCLRFVFIVLDESDRQLLANPSKQNDVDDESQLNDARQQKLSHRFKMVERKIQHNLIFNTRENLNDEILKLIDKTNNKRTLLI